MTDGRRICARVRLTCNVSRHPPRQRRPIRPFPNSRLPRETPEDIGEIRFFQRKAVFTNATAKNTCDDLSAAVSVEAKQSGACLLPRLASLALAMTGPT